jgi:LPS sulfotransferase NodH
MRYTESQVSSELLDQPLFAGEPRKVFICSTPRSGSYMLCRYMINAGLGVPHEYFNPIIIRDIAPRLGLGAAIEGLQWRPRNLRDKLPLRSPARVAEENFLAKYLAALVPIRCVNGVFAAKVHFGQFVKVLDNPTGRKLLERGVFIHLYREDLLKQAVSTHFSNLTGRWSIDDAVATVPQEKPDFFNVPAIDRTLQGLAEDDLGWRVFLARNGISALTISYEQLRKDPFGFVAAIARKLGFDPAGLDTSYTEPDEPVADEQSGVPGRADVARRYLAAVRTLPQASPEVAAPPGPARSTALEQAG